MHSHNITLLHWLPLTKYCFKITILLTSLLYGYKLILSHCYMFTLLHYNNVTLQIDTVLHFQQSLAHNYTHKTRCGAQIMWRCSTLKDSTVQYSTVQYSTVQYSTVQYSTVQYSTVQYNTIMYCNNDYFMICQYSTVQYSIMVCSTAQYSSVECNTVHYIVWSWSV